MLKCACPEDCPAYLGTGALDPDTMRASGLAACDMTRQDYLEGSWRQLPQRCRPQSVADVEKLAYPYTRDCAENQFQCLPEGRPGRCASYEVSNKSSALTTSSVQRTGAERTPVMRVPALAG